MPRSPWQIQHSIYHRTTKRVHISLDVRQTFPKLCGKWNATLTILFESTDSRFGNKLAIIYNALLVSYFFQKNRPLRAYHVGLWFKKLDESSDRFVLIFRTSGVALLTVCLEILVIYTLIERVGGGSKPNLFRYEHEDFKMRHGFQSVKFKFHFYKFLFTSCSEVAERSVFFI